MNEDSKLILLTDIIENKLRKESELRYYQEQLEKLQFKMGILSQEIRLTEVIIDMIEKERVLDIRAELEKKMLENKKGK